MCKNISNFQPFFLVLAVLAALSGCSNSNHYTIKTISSAGTDKGELKKVLKHYRGAGDEQKLAAAKFLISNMPGHGYVEAVFYNDKDEEVPFEATDYENYKQATAALDQLEKEHGELHYQRKTFIDDTTVIKADYLIENIDLAFVTWKQNQWARSLSFEAFCEHILPYRCSNEPINNWRKELVERFEGLPEKMTDPSNAKEASGLINKDIHKLVRFDTLYYLHPTDQGFDEMLQTGKGRCEDISNMISYAMRANGIAVASDYTPAWANRDNNHAWNAHLDSQGRGSAGLGNIAAKVYRKMYSTQKDAITFRKKKDETIPRWLKGTNFIDVTDQYFETSDVSVKLIEEEPADVSFAYLCVFNGGKWVPICSGDIDSGKALFTKLGRGIVYLPAYYADDNIHPAAPPFILTKGGKVELLNGTSDNNDNIEVEITTLKPATDDDDTHIEIPRIVVKPDKKYKMLYWNGQWESLGSRTATDEPVTFDNLPKNRLYWMVEENSKKLERIFTVKNDKQLWW
ncbi:MAG: hypothetical protein KAS23_15905 [Anaerohalosphaera sp.]|nr:hypothetical protein [Anaerohalosphaera sp.]